jgi:sarcosine oxidase subunit gamma
VIREDVADTLGFHLLADSASAEYLWDCVLDAMHEFGGRPATLSALGELAGSHATVAEVRPG